MNLYLCICIFLKLILLMLIQLSQATGSDIFSPGDNKTELLRLFPSSSRTNNDTGPNSGEKIRQKRGWGLAVVAKSSKTSVKATSLTSKSAISVPHLAKTTPVKISSPLKPKSQMLPSVATIIPDAVPLSPKKVSMEVSNPVLNMKSGVPEASFSNSKIDLKKSSTPMESPVSKLDTLDLVPDNVKTLPTAPEVSQASPRTHASMLEPVVTDMNINKLSKESMELKPSISKIDDGDMSAAPVKNPKEIQAHSAENSGHQGHGEQQTYGDISGSNDKLPGESRAPQPDHSISKKELDIDQPDLGQDNGQRMPTDSSNSKFQKEIDSREGPVQKSMSSSSPDSRPGQRTGNSDAIPMLDDSSKVSPKSKKAELEGQNKPTVDLTDSKFHPPNPPIAFSNDESKNKPHKTQASSATSYGLLGSGKGKAFSSIGAGVAAALTNLEKLEELIDFCFDVIHSEWSLVFFFTMVCFYVISIIQKVLQIVWKLIEISSTVLELILKLGESILFCLGLIVSLMVFLGKQFATVARFLVECYDLFLNLASPSRINREIHALNDILVM